MILTLSNQFVAQVSPEDFELVNKSSWQAQVRDGKVIAVYRSCNGKTIYLAHEILQRRDINIPKLIDHKDRDPLNNRFDNLRPATSSQNNANHGLKSSNSTGYIGVCYDKRHLKYRAKIQVRKVTLNLGLFTDPKEAARVRDAAAKRYFGEFAVLNFTEC